MCNLAMWCLLIQKRRESAAAVVAADLEEGYSSTGGGQWWRIGNPEKALTQELTQPGLSLGPGGIGGVRNWEEVTTAKYGARGGD